MERKLIKSRIKVIDFIFSSKKHVFTKLIFNSYENQENYINKIIYALKHSDNIKFYLAEECLPKIVLDEIKWLKYYNYDTKFIVSDEKIKKSLNSYSDDIAIDSSIKSNIMEITDDSKTLYKFNKLDILELISIEQLLKDSSYINNELFNFLSYKNLPEGKQQAKSFKMFNDIKQLEIYLEQNQDANVAYVENETFKIENSYIGLGSKLYKEIDFMNEKYYQSIQGDFDVYVNIEDKSEQTYTIVNDKIIKLNKEDTKTINLCEKTKNFQDYENENITIDIEEEISKHGDYNKFSINCKIEPPYMEPQDRFRISSRYDSVKNVLLNLKKNILKKMNIDIEMLEDKKLRNLVQSIKSFVLVKDNITLDIKDLQLLNFEFGELNDFEEVLRKYYDEFMRSSRLNFNTGIIKIDKEIEFLKSKLSATINNDSKEYKRLTEDILHLTNIRNDYNIKYSLANTETIDFDKLLEDQSLKDMSSNKSLGRIVNSKDLNVLKDSIQHRLLKTIASFLMISKFVHTAIKEIEKLDIPSVGVLYENDSKLGLAIKYEDEIEEAKRIIKKCNYKLFVEKENLL